MNVFDAQLREKLVTSNGPWQYIIVFGVLTLGIGLGALFGANSAAPTVSAAPAMSVPETASTPTTAVPTLTATTPSDSHAIPVKLVRSDKPELYSVRQAFEQSGWSVTWDDPKQEVVCRSKTGSVVTIDMETHTATVDGKAIGTVTSCVVKNGAVYGLSDFLEKATEGSFHPGAQGGR